MPAWRPLRPADLPALCRLADAVHAEHPEAPAVFAERLALAPGFCLALAGEAGLFGYAIAHPWAGPPPPLDSLLDALPGRPDHLLLHDIALAPAARGGGQAQAALALLLATARRDGLGEVRLVAIAGKGEYWRRRGFAARGPAPPSYGAGAELMQRAL